MSKMSLLSLIQGSESASGVQDQGATAETSQEATSSKKGSSTQRYTERHQYCVNTIQFFVLNCDLKKSAVTLTTDALIT